MRRPLLAGLAIVIALGVLLFVRVREQEARALGPPSGSGTIEGTVVDHAARIASRVVRLHVREGDSVHAGDLLAELDCAEPQARLAELDARIAAANAQARAARAQVEAAGRQARAASASARATAAQLEVLDTSGEAARREEARLAQMGEYVAPMTRDRASDAVRTVSSQESAVRAQASAARAQASAVSAQRDTADATADAASEQIEALRALRVVSALAVAECEVRARRDGVVETLYFDEGELVSPGTPIVRLVDAREVTVTFYLPNAEVGVVTPGASAFVVADAFPDQRFEGTVRTVAMQAAFTPRTVQTRSDRDRLVYPVEVVVENPELRLRPGMPAEVTMASTTSAPGARPTEASAR